MKNFLTTILQFCMFTTTLAMQTVTLPGDLYTREAEQLLSKFNLEDPHFTNPVMFYLTQRVAMAGRAISITDRCATIEREDLLQREAAYVNHDIISAFMAGYVKHPGNGMFMLDFANIVENNVLHILMQTTKYYCGEELDQSEACMNLKLTNKDDFAAIINTKFSHEQLLILSVLESKKFAAIVQQKIMNVATQKTPNT